MERPAIRCSFSSQSDLVVPSDKAISEIGTVFNRMIKTYCAISKLEYLLEAVRLTYENVSPSCRTLWERCRAYV